ASPVLLWQLWAFVRPALYPEEKKLALGWTFLSLFLFVLGVTFGYVAVFSSALSFFVYVGADTALPLLALDRYVSFLIGFVLPFGIIFEMPLA
ncbi:preprotein translocase subunit TatC, partial [Klebsiella pneumoniae]|nr:preprotein translocase subunit TatC [Klebsiella pneumoniae]